MQNEAVTIKYDDQTTRGFLWATLIWGLVGMSVGLLIAVQLAWWPANTGLPWLSFGRLRPLHTSAVVFAFTGNAMFMAIYYSMQRLLKTRMWSDKLSKFTFWGWQFIIVAVAVSYIFGVTQAKEYAEMEWPIDLAITVVWVAFLINF
jgi:cytochrome c oxidase cbb3-type subunit I/II